MRTANKQLIIKYKNNCLKKSYKLKIKKKNTHTHFPDAETNNN